VSPEALALDGSYGGFQPKPAVEVIIVAMKPLSEKTFVDQALKNRHGITWLDNGRIPYQTNRDKESAVWGKDAPCNVYGWSKGKRVGMNDGRLSSVEGRFPANLLVSDDVLNDGRKHKTNSTGKGIGYTKFFQTGEVLPRHAQYDDDAGSFSRYFDLDRWFDERIKRLPRSARRTFPFLIVPKASRSEKLRGLESSDLEERVSNPNYGKGGFKRPTGEPERQVARTKNFHPTVKPLKLMSYLVALGSRPYDVVLDPFVGTGTTCLAARILGREWIGIEIVPEYVRIAKARLGLLEKEPPP